jgi:hypothetical protein
MDNTKRETFRRLLDSRLPKATKAIKLLGNLSRKGQYEYTHLEAQELIKGLKNEVTTLATKFKVTTTTPEPTATAPDTPTEGALDRNDRSNLAWAHDMLRRGQTKDATTLITRILKQQQGDT